MAFILVSFTCFQFAFGVLSMRESALYTILNPYVLLAPFLLVWLGFVAFQRRTADKNLLLGCAAVVVIQTFVFPAFSQTADFPFTFLRSIQFFWGPSILLPCLLGLLATVSFDSTESATEIARSYIKALCLIASLITVAEVVAVDVLGMSPLAIPYVDPQSNSLYPFRPFGLAEYPQVNAVVLALLFWLSYIYGVRGVGHKILVLVALALTRGGTGQIAFLVLLPMLSRRPFLAGAILVAPLAAVVAVATYTHQLAAGSVWQKFDLAYIDILVNIFSTVMQLYLPQFTDGEIVFGSASGSLDSAVGLTHDWAYFDVFYVYGLVGVLGYVILYGMLIGIACPTELGFSRRIYFAITMLALNFHYGVLNYFVGQLMFTTLAAIQLRRRYGLGRHTAPTPSPQLA